MYQRFPLITVESVVLVYVLESTPNVAAIPRDGVDAAKAKNDPQSQHHQIMISKVFL